MSFTLAEVYHEWSSLEIENLKNPFTHLFGRLVYKFDARGLVSVLYAILITVYTS